MKKVCVLFAFVVIALSARALAASSPVVANRTGGWCIDAESAAKGAKVVYAACSAASTQTVTYDGHLRIGGFCAQADRAAAGSELHLQACSDDAAQKFTWNSNTGFKIIQGSFVVGAPSGFHSSNKGLALLPADNGADKMWDVAAFVTGYKRGQLPPPGTSSVRVPGLDGSVPPNVFAASPGASAAAATGNIVAARTGL